MKSTDVAVWIGNDIQRKAGQIMNTSKDLPTTRQRIYDLMRNANFGSLPPLSLEGESFKQYANDRIWWRNTGTREDLEKELSRPGQRLEDIDADFRAIQEHWYKPVQSIWPRYLRRPDRNTCSHGGCQRVGGQMHSVEERLGDIRV